MPHAHARDEKIQVTLDDMVCYFNANGKTILRADD